VQRHVVEVGECWEWQAALQWNSPVPVINYNGKVAPVRRHIAQYILKLPLEGGKLATCNCGNKLCVNPAHVVLITRKKLQQRIAKESRHLVNPVRMKKLSDRARAAQAKLTLQQALEIRDAEGKQRDIAARYGITQATVSAIKRGKTWRDYSNPFAQLIGGLNK
jgi:hypothetical protein